MKIEDIRDLLHARPFQAFVLHTADERAFPVPHPDFVLVAHGGRTLVVNSTTDESFTLLDVMLVPRVEVPVTGSPAPAPESNQPS